MHEPAAIVTEAEFLERLKAGEHGDDTIAMIDKLGFTPAFILKHVFSGAGPISVAHIAMLWQGMPNKHDRKRTQALLEALTAAGLLRADATGESWTLT